MNEPRIALVAPWPPPEGGMSVQAVGLSMALRSAGTTVLVVPTIVSVGPFERIESLRGPLNRLLFLFRLCRVIPQVDVIHVLSASGRSFFHFTAPCIALGRLLSRRVIVNYRSGSADEFLSKKGRWIRPFLQSASLLVVPSGYLANVFQRHGYDTRILPNFVDLTRFKHSRKTVPRARILVTRNLEPLYNIDAALKAFAIVRSCLTDAELWVIGTGSEESRLRRKARALDLGDAVRFFGAVANDTIAEYYEVATLALNPTNVDNMPISILEAFAAGVPVVSTRAGGVPYLVEHERTGLLVDVGDYRGLAAACLRIINDQELACKLQASARIEVERYRLDGVIEAWRNLYRDQTVNSPASS